MSPLFRCPVSQSPFFSHPRPQDEPQSAEQIHRRLVVSYGESNTPALTTIQSTLSAKGEKLGVKIKDASKKVTYVQFSAGASALTAKASTSTEEEAKPRPRLKAKKDRGAADKVEAHEAMRSKLDGFLTRPLSAFALFGLAQRGVLKKQKSSAAVKEIVKAVGERWLLLSEAERKKYEAMAEEDAQRAASGVALMSSPAPAIEADHAG